MSRLLIAALVLGLALAPFLFVQPARALQMPPILSIGPTLFAGVDGNAVLTAGSQRVGKIPLFIGAETTVFTLPAAYPITCSFIWGDGAVNITTVASAQTSDCNAYHTYTIAGTYNLNLNVTDLIGSTRNDVYKVVAYAATGASPWWRTFIEGKGVVTNLSRQTSMAGPIMAFVYNNGTNTMASGFTATWYMTSWSNPLYTVTYPKAVLIGEYFPFVWPGNIPQVITTPGTYNFWVKTVAGARNITSGVMPVVYSSDVAIPSMSVAEPSQSIYVPNAQTPVKNTFTITNTGTFTINFVDSLTIFGSGGGKPAIPCCQIDPASLAMQFGPIINGTIQTYFLVNAFTLIITTLDNPPLAGIGVLLQPGEHIALTQEVREMFAGSPTASSGTYEIVFTPYAAGSCVAVNACTISGNPVTITNSVLGLVAGTTQQIQTAYGTQIGNGTVLLVGYVIQMGTDTYMNVWFSFTMPNGTTYTTPTTQTTVPTTIRAYLTGLPIGNFTFEMLATGSTGDSLKGGILTFQVGTQTSVGPGSNGEGFTQAFLYAIASAAGMPAIYVGLLIGITVLFGMLMLLMVMSSIFEVDIPGFIWILVLILGTVLNTLFFLWPSWLDLIIVVFGGLFLWQIFTGGGSPSTGGGSPG